MVAVLSSWHEYHERACHEVENRLDRKQGMIVAGPALIETYSVLTRLPAPHRIAPVDALRLLEHNFIQNAEVITLGGPAYGILLREAARDAVSGGRVYDAVIAACARKARVHALLTLNEKHFAPFADGNMEIVVP